MKTKKLSIEFNTEFEKLIAYSFLVFLRKQYFNELDKAPYPAPNTIDPELIKKVYNKLLNDLKD